MLVCNIESDAISNSKVDSGNTSFWLRLIGASTSTTSKKKLHTSVLLPRATSLHCPIEIEDSTLSMSENQNEPQYAPWYRLPTRHIVAVEHPGIVKNVDRAIKTLQGDAGISKVSFPLMSKRVVTNS
jgi:hypothetical protein